jgi:triacylglycerol lipase
VPQRNARLDHPGLLVTNYLFRDVGHLSLAVDSRAVHAVLAALTQSQRTRPSGEHATTPPRADLTIDTAPPNAIRLTPSTSS